MREEKPFALSVKAVIRDGTGRMLLIRRHPESTWWPGEWEAPGGKPDPGETFDQALLREVREETGLEVVLTGVAGVSRFEIDKLSIVLLVMTARVVGGELRLSDEHTDALWAPLKDLATIGLTAPLVDALLRPRPAFISAQVTGP